MCYTSGVGAIASKWFEHRTADEGIILGKKVWNIIILILNAAGILCLIYYAVLYFMHDTAVPNPEAMIPFQRWEASAMILTFGLIPLVAVNTLALVFVGKEKIRMPLRMLFFAPSIVCLGIVLHYWIS